MQVQKFEYLENKKSFLDKIKTPFIVFEELSFGENKNLLKNCGFKLETLSFGSSNPGEIWKTTYRNETKSISVWVSQFLVNSLFYIWTFIKREFLRI